MQASQKNNHFNILDQKPNSVCIVVPRLFNDKERAAILKIILLKRSSIKSVQISTENNSVEIKFDPEKLPIEGLFNVLDVVLESFSEKSSKHEVQERGVSVKNEGAIQRVVFSVGGMSCPSCALFIEMTLARDKGVINANVDFKSAKGVVIGFLSLSEVLAIIDGRGYKACKG